MAEAFIKGAAASGSTSLKSDLGILLRLERSYGRDALVRALERAVAFGRFHSSDVQSILIAGRGVAQPFERATRSSPRCPLGHVAHSVTTK